MAEDGIDISGHTSNHVDEYLSIDFDYVITVCDSAKERCPLFSKRSLQFHHNFPDPAKATGTEEEIQQSFRSTRNLIKDYCENFTRQYLKP
jgi:arsenate reductase